MGGSVQPSVVLVVNANVSRDVRRLTSLARAVGVHERVDTVAGARDELAAIGTGS